ncbi:hypothetical protein ACMGDE_01570 [Parapedobacter sp. DT-150]
MPDASPTIELLSFSAREELAVPMSGKDVPLNLEKSNNQKYEKKTNATNHHEN